METDDEICIGHLRAFGPWILMMMMMSKDAKCRCCEFGISCRALQSLLDKAVSLEDTSVDQVYHHVHSTKYGEFQASIGGLQSKAVKVKDGATKPDLPPKLIASDTGFYRGCYKVSVLAFACLFAVADSRLVEQPKNTVILKGESTNVIDLSCKSDRGYRLVWFLNKNQGSEMELLYNGYDLRPDVKHYCTVITDEPGKCYLNLTNTAEAAQTYICLEPGTLAEVSADLIWLDYQICNESSTEHFVNLTCSVEFRGNWAPTMEWKELSSHGEEVLTVGVNTVTVPNQRVNSTLVIEVQKGSRNYTCSTKFDISGKPPNTATNVPDYNRIWTFAVFIKSEGSKKDHRNVLEIITLTAIVTKIVGVTGTLV